MQLAYFRGSVSNFGDDINAVLWPTLAPNLFDENGTTGFVGIGTIIGRPFNEFRRLHVFSSGAGNDSIERWADREVTYWCVRGPISAAFLGVDPDRALSDGAILAPTIPHLFPAKKTGGDKVLVIPHWQSLEDSGWAEAVRLAGFELLDPRGSPESVIASIADARLVLTESLHGAIMADTYGVPWAAFVTSGNFQISKWLDWTRSVGRSFHATVLPPPSTPGFLRHGRPMAPLGTRVSMTDDEALASMRGRADTAMTHANLISKLKARLVSTGLLNGLYRFSPARTAEALTKLAGQTTEPSAPATIERLQSRMLNRLDQFRRDAT